MVPHDSYDVIGDVVTCAKMELVTTSKGKQQNKITLQIQDLNGFKLHLTLWDTYAQEMSDYVTNQPDKFQVVIILQFAKVMYYRECPYVSNSFNVSRLFINSEIDEISSFRNNLLRLRGEDKSHVSLVSTMSYSLIDDFLVNTEMKSIADLIEVHEVRSLIVVGTIKLVRQDVPWFYEGCIRCARKVKITYELTDKLDGSQEVKDIPTYECSNKKCKGSVITVGPRFMIHLRVQDETGIVSLTLFDREAVKLLHKSATDLWEKYKELGDIGIFPEEFNELVDKTFAFKVDVTDWNLTNNSHIYGISILLDNEKIITDLQKKINGQQPAESESLNVTYSDLGSHKHLKDAVSCTGDGATPCNVDKSTASSPLAKNKNAGRGICGAMDLKRNLDDVYDEEDTTKMSATKTPRKAAEDDKQQPMKTLLIPKKEK